MMRAMTETARGRYERRERQSQQLLRFLRAGPHEPKATLAEVQEVACPNCGARTGEPCDTNFPRVSIAGMVFKGFSGIHMRRYLDRTHDPR